MTDNLRNRFIDYSVTPPSSVWDEIAAELSGELDHKAVREKIFGTQINPPDSVWPRITSLLVAKPLARKPFFQIRSLNKAAAIMAGVVLIGSLYFLINKHPEKSSVSISDLASGNRDLPEPSPKVVLPQKPVLAQASSSLPRMTSLYSTIRSKKKIFSSSKRYLYKSIIRDKEDLLPPLVSIPAKPIRNENGDIIQDSKLLSKSNDQYVSVTSPNGEQTKISAKFVNLLLYLNGDNDSDQRDGVFHKSFLESLIWKTKFQSWRNTISQTSFIPTSTNFMDILEMRDLILQQTEIN